MAYEPLERVSLLVLAVVQSEDVRDLVDELTERGFGATRIDSSGGFLFQNNAVVLVGTDEGRLGAVLDAISQTCKMRVSWAPTMPVGEPLAGVAMPIEVEVGGAVIFAVPVERCVRLVGAPSGALAGSAATRR